MRSGGRKSRLRRRLQIVPGATLGAHSDDLRPEFAGVARYGSADGIDQHSSSEGPVDRHTGRRLYHLGRRQDQSLLRPDLS